MEEHTFSQLTHCRPAHIVLVRMVQHDRLPLPPLILPCSRSSSSDVRLMVLMIFQPIHPSPIWATTSATIFRYSGPCTYHITTTFSPRYGHSFPLPSSDTVRHGRSAAGARCSRCPCVVVLFKSRAKCTTGRRKPTAGISRSCITRRLSSVRPLRRRTCQARDGNYREPDEGSADNALPRDFRGEL
jgi:hypothetical protein